MFSKIISLLPEKILSLSQSNRQVSQKPPKNWISRKVEVTHGFQVINIRRSLSVSRGDTRGKVAHVACRDNDIRKQRDSAPVHARSLGATIDEDIQTCICSVTLLVVGVKDYEGWAYTEIYWVICVYVTRLRAHQVTTDESWTADLPFQADTPRCFRLYFSPFFFFLFPFFFINAKRKRVAL